MSRFVVENDLTGGVEEGLYRGKSRGLRFLNPRDDNLLSEVFG